MKTSTLIPNTRSARRKTRKQDKIKVAKVEGFLRSFAENEPIEMAYNGDVIRLMVVMYTPELAAKILEEFNENNRKLSKRMVNFLSKEVNEGNWVMNGDTISFDTNGDLANGQHRLETIINTGVSLPYLTIVGLDPEVFKSIDTGAGRSGSDVMSIEGIKNSTHVSSTVKFIFAFRNGKYSANRHHHRTLSNTSLIDYYYELGDEKVNKSLKFFNGVKQGSKGLISPSLITGLHYILSDINEDLGSDFLNKLCTGIGLEANSPITALRNKILKSKIEKTYKLTNEDLLKNIVHAWNKFKKGETSKTLKVPAELKIELV